MKQLTVLVVLILVVAHVKSSAHIQENQLSPFVRKQLLVNLLRALQTLRNHHEEKRTGVAFRRPSGLNSNRKNHIEKEASSFVKPITKSVYGVQSLVDHDQISKQTKELKKKRNRNPKDSKLFHKLLLTLKSLKKQNEKKRQRKVTRAKYFIKQQSKKTKKNHFPTILSWQHEQRKQIPDVDQRSSVLKPIRQLAKNGKTQTSKARYSFAQARLSFLQALENAQDEKLSKLDNLQKMFSYILPKNENESRFPIRNDIKSTVQDFKTEESAARLSKIGQPNKNSLLKQSWNANRIKKPLLRNTMEKQSSSTKLTIQRKKSNSLLHVSRTGPNTNKIHAKMNSNPKMDLKSIKIRKLPKHTENHSHQLKQPNELFPSMMDDLLSISNARNKLEKLKRLQKLQAKLLHHFKVDKRRSEDNENTFWKVYDDNMPSRRYNNKSMSQSVRISLFDNLKHQSKYKNPKKIVYDKPNQRHKEEQGFQKDDIKDGQNLSGEVGSKSQEHVAKQVGEYVDSYDDFVISPHSGKDPANSTFGYTNYRRLGIQQTSSNSVQSYSNRPENNTKKEKQNKMTTAHFSGIPLKVDQTQSQFQYSSGHGSKALTHFPEINKNSLNESAIIGDFNHNHQKNGRNVMGPSQHADYLDILAQNVERDQSQRSGSNIIGETQQSKFHESQPQYSSSKNKNGHESDHSYLPLDSSVSTNSLPAVLSENEKIISELKASKPLAKHLSINKTENSHKRLSKILLKAQSMFIEKVKEILAGQKTGGNEKSKNTIKSNKNSKNSKEKHSKAGVINTSAYVMDESPSQVPNSTKVSQDSSEIVPKTPTNDDLLSSLNGNMVQAAPQPQNSGATAQTQSLSQSPFEANSPMQVQPLRQSGPEQPVSGPPLTYRQLQEAHEEEKVALEQENAFRNIQNGAKESLNGISTSFQSYMGSNQLPQGTHYAIQNTGFNPPNVDDLSEYTGGIERYQLSHQMGYDSNTDNENEIGDIPRRNHFHLYGHRVEDDEDDEDYDDDDEDDDDMDEGKKKSSIGKPRDFVEYKHRIKHEFRNTLNSTETELYKTSPNVNANTKQQNKCPNDIDYTNRRTYKNSSIF